MDAETRRTVRGRAGHRCEYCRLPESIWPARFHIDHIVARQHQGGDDPENLALACPRCNRAKGSNLTGIDPLTGRMHALFNPRQESWEAHFRIDGAMVLGTTAVGRATVQTLAMNAEDRVRLRMELLAGGEL